VKIIATLKRIDILSFWVLLKLAVRHPMFVYPTFKATKVCLQVSTMHFGRAHYKNTSANAFRHAYWNYLIAKKCTKWSKNRKRIVSWTKLITDWHENAFKNRELAKLMDLHNNAIGRAIFQENHEKSIEEVTELLLKMTKKSVKIQHKEEFSKNKFTLVHISDI